MVVEGVCGRKAEVGVAGVRERGLCSLWLGLKVGVVGLGVAGVAGVRERGL